MFWGRILDVQCPYSLATPCTVRTEALYSLVLSDRQYKGQENLSLLSKAFLCFPHSRSQSADRKAACMLQTDVRWFVCETGLTVITFPQLCAQGIHVQS